jgi:hypothetical protein
LKPGIVIFKADVSADQLRAGGPVHEEESTTIFADLPEWQIKAFWMPFPWPKQGKQPARSVSK